MSHPWDMEKLVDSIPSRVNTIVYAKGEAPRYMEDNSCFYFFRTYSGFLSSDLNQIVFNSFDSSKSKHSARLDLYIFIWAYIV